MNQAIEEVSDETQEIFSDSQSTTSYSNQLQCSECIIDCNENNGILNTDLIRQKYHEEARIYVKNCKYIEPRSFKYLLLLNEIILDYRNDNIPENCFQSCNEVTKITINGFVKTIGDHAFTECYKLQYVELPDTVKIIGDGCFCGCSNLQEFQFPKQIEYIGNNAFAACQNLQYVRIMNIFNSTVVIKERCFINCTALETIDINSNVIMCESAIGYCSILNTVQLKGKLMLNANCIQNCNIHWLQIKQRTGSEISTDAVSNCTIDALEIMRIPRLFLHRNLIFPTTEINGLFTSENEHLHILGKPDNIKWLTLGVSFSEKCYKYGMKQYLLRHK